MKSIPKLFLFSFFFLTLTFSGTMAQQEERFVKQLKLSTGETVVVTEGAFEARSLGSYSVRLYEANSDSPTDFFICGLVASRDGGVEKVITRDITGDGVEEIIVIIRSAGTGGYLSADALQYNDRQIRIMRRVADLAKNADPVAALTEVSK